MIPKARADELVFRQGLTESKEQARRLIMAGKVALLSSAGAGEESTVPVNKPGHAYPESVRFVLVGQERFVSRGAYKLLTALEHFQPPLANRVCLDAGASTGGFTDCLLQHGAARVYAVDVGRAQLHEKLRADPRVISLEQTNMRTAPESLIPEPVDLIVADVSFISLRLIIPPSLRWLKPDGWIIGLIKPQFEVGPHQTRKGVVRDEAIRQEAVDAVCASCSEQGLICLGVIPAAIKGPKGNQEYLAAWRWASATPQTPGRSEERSEP